MSEAKRFKFSPRFLLRTYIFQPNLLHPEQTGAFSFGMEFQHQQILQQGLQIKKILAKLFQHLHHLPFNGIFFVHGCHTQSDQRPICKPCHFSCRNLLRSLLWTTCLFRDGPAQVYYTSHYKRIRKFLVADKWSAYSTSIQ